MRGASRLNIRVAVREIWETGDSVPERGHEGRAVEFCPAIPGPGGQSCPGHGGHSVAGFLLRRTADADRPVWCDPKRDVSVSDWDGDSEAAPDGGTPAIRVDCN